MVKVKVQEQPEIAAQCMVTVKAKEIGQNTVVVPTPVNVTELSLAQSAVTLKINDTLSVALSVLPENADGGSLSYAKMFAPHYVPLSTATDYIPTIVTGETGRDYKFLTSMLKRVESFTAFTVRKMPKGKSTAELSDIP